MRGRTVIISIATVCAVVGITFATYAARIISVSTCEGISETGTVPIGITDRFTTQAQAIHAVAVLDGVARGTILTGTWVSVDAIDVPNYLIDSAVVPVEQAGQVRAHFALSRPNSGWPTGNYRLDFYIDGALATSVPFMIGVAAGGNQPAVRPQAPPPMTAPDQAAAPSSATGFSGTYTASGQSGSMTLVFQEGANGALSGTLTIGGGASMSIEGMVSEGAAVGACANDREGYYFEAYPDGGKLTVNLIAPGANNEPDYTRVQEVIFTRQGAAASAPMPTMGAPSGRAQPTAPAAYGNAGLSSETISDPSWGFVIHPPVGWKSQKNAQGVLLGHDAIAGMIIVFPHQAPDMQTVQSQMQVGLTDEGVQLSLAGALQQIGTNAVGGDYTGIYNGQQAKARGIGTVSPYGGGAYILAITTPEKYTNEIVRAADAVATGMEYGRAQAPQGSDAMQFLAGTWVTMTRNTETRVTLTADGGYFENYEASYSGSSSDGMGNQDMSWGTAGNNQSQGRWTAQGSREQGVITITYANGNNTSIEYRVHVENGETYWNEYWFNGELYGRQR
jgi:hypothetical protein